MPTQVAFPIMDSRSTPPPSFPAASLMVALLCTGGSLMVAAAGWQWGAVPSAAGWWTRVWLYVNLAMGFLWFLAWPVLARRPNADRQTLGLVIRWLGMALGCFPALWLAFYFGSPPAGPLWQCLAMQLCWAIFAFGIVAMAAQCGDGGTAATGMLSFLYLMGPLLSYILAEFTQVSHVWFGFAPPVDLFAAAHGSGDSALIWAGSFGVIGLLLTGWTVGRHFAQSSRDQGLLPTQPSARPER